MRQESDRQSSIQQRPVLDVVCMKDSLHAELQAQLRRLAFGQVLPQSRMFL